MFSPVASTLRRVGFPVAVFVAQIDDVPAVGDDHAVFDENAGGAMAEAFGEDRHFVRVAVAVGVFEDLDLVLSAAGLVGNVVRVAETLDHPSAALGVPVDGDRIDDHRLAGEKHQFGAGGNLGVRGAVCGGQRLLQLHHRDLRMRAVRDLRNLRHQRWEFEPGEFPGLFLADGPENAAFHENLIGLLVPATKVVAAGSVEDAALALVAGPRPWLGFGLALVHRLADLQQVAVRGEVHVLIGLVPRFEHGQVLGDRVLGIDGFRAEFKSFVALESAADEIEPILGRVEIPAGAVQGDERATVFHPWQDRFRHLGFFMVRIDDQGVIQIEIRAGDFAEILDEANVESLRPECLLEDAVTFEWVVMAIVAEEQDFQPTGFRRGRDDGQQADEGDG